MKRAEESEKTDNAKWLRRASYASVCVALLLVFGKFFAWWRTGSVAILSSLVDSLLDASASIFALFALRHALKPADAEHRFGHGKIEALASLGQSAFIGGTSVFLLFQALRRFWHPRVVHDTWFGVWIMVAATILSIGLVVLQTIALRKSASLVVEADSLHYKSDLLMNVGVIVALMVGYFVPTFLWVEPLLAILIALYITYGAYRIGRTAVDQLMDRELSDAERDLILKVVRAHKGVLGAHDLRTRRSGSRCFIQLHLELSDDLSLWEAHQIADEVEAGIYEYFSDAEVIIHQDPHSIVEERPAFDT